MDLDKAVTARVTCIAEPSVPCRELGYRLDGEGLSFPPVSHWAPRSVRISVIARGTEMRARPIEMSAVSQDHWCGYSRGAAITMVPRSFSSRTLVTRWANCTVMFMSATPCPVTSAISIRSHA